MNEKYEKKEGCFKMISIKEINDKQNNNQNLFIKSFLIKIPKKHYLYDSSSHITTNNYMYWQAINKKIDLKTFIIENQRLDSMCKNFCILFLHIFTNRSVKISAEIIEKIVYQILIRKDIPIIKNTNDDMISDTFQLFYALFLKFMYIEFVKHCVYFPNKKIKLLNFDENVQKHHQNTSLMTSTYGLNKSSVHYLVNLRASKKMTSVK